MYRRQHSRHEKNQNVYANEDTKCHGRVPCLDELEDELELAAGNNVPPMVIHKRKRMKIELTNGRPPGAVYSCQYKGWVSNEGFVTWLKHFVDSVKPTKEETVVLLLDGHVTHAKNLVAIEMAREAAVVMVSLPPHTTHRLQPLDGAFSDRLGNTMMLH